MRSDTRLKLVAGKLGMTPQTLLAKLDSLDDPQCWIWQGGYRREKVVSIRRWNPVSNTYEYYFTKHKAFPRIRVDGKELRVLRYLWILILGPEEMENVYCQSICDNPLCVNPLHSRLFTKKDPKTEEAPPLPDLYLEHPWLQHTSQERFSHSY